MSAMSDEEYAKLFKKITSRKTNIGQIKTFLQESFLRSSFKDKISNVPKIITGDSDLLAGQYDALENSVFIGNSIFEDIIRGSKGSLGDLIDTFGHECTHALQTNEKDLDHRLINEQEVENVFNYLNLNYDGDLQEFCDLLSFSSYYITHHEVMAREGGNRYSKEVFADLKNNMYLKGKWQKVVEEQLKGANEKYFESKKQTSSFETMYYNFAKIVAQYPISYFLDKEKELVDRGFPQPECFAFFNSLRLKTEGEDPFEVCEDFVTVLEKNCLFTKRSLMDKISTFSEEQLSRLRGTIVPILIKKDCSKFAFQIDLQRVLEKEDYVNIYRGILKNGDFEKINSKFMKSFISNGDGRKVFENILFDELSKGSLKIENSKDMERFKSHLGLFLDDTRKNLEHICDQLGVVSLQTNNIKR